MESVSKSSHYLYTPLPDKSPHSLGLELTQMIFVLAGGRYLRAINSRDPSELFLPSLRLVSLSVLHPQVTSRFAQVMLPRSLLSTAARSAARRRLQVASSRDFRMHFVGNHRTNNALSISAVAQFHSSARRHNELPKSPFQTFVDVLKDELRKNREFAENVKQLQGDVDKFQDSEAMKKAKDAYERARVCFKPPLYRVQLGSFSYVAAGLQHQGEPQITRCG